MPFSLDGPSFFLQTFGLIGLSSLWLHLVNRHVTEPYLVINETSVEFYAHKLNDNRMSIFTMIKQSVIFKIDLLSGIPKSPHRLACR